MIYVIDDATSLEQNKIFEEEFDNTELESIPATVPHFNPEGYRKVSEYIFNNVKQLLD